MAYFVNYLVSSRENDKIVNYPIPGPVDSVYGLEKIDEDNCGGPIEIFEVNPKNIAQVKKIRSIVFVDKEKSLKYQKTRICKNAKPYAVYLGASIVGIYQLNEKEHEIVDWQDYQEHYDERHAQYLASHKQIEQEM